jgi:hypothetical protein
MTAKNEHTGALLNTKAATDDYREGHERIFGDKLPWYKRRDLEKQANPPNSPIVTDGYKHREALHTESVMDHLAHRDAERPMSDREWAAQPANLREGCTVHVPGVGDI